MKKSLFWVRNFLFVILFVGIGFNSVHAKQAEWLKQIKRIEVLKTTKAEVEKLFDNPKVIEIDDLAVKFKNGWGKTIKYETKYGLLEISYAAGKCSENKSLYSWDIAADVVVEMTFSPNDIVFENQLGYNLGKFEKDADSETDKIYSLETGKSGIKIEVEDAKVSFVNFFITEKHLKQLECKNIKVKEPIWFENLMKLELFKTTRNDLEILFENPRIVEVEDDSEDGGWGLNVKYETIYGNLELEYSTGTCSETKSKYGYDVEKDRIVRLHFEPIEESDFTELNFDLRNSKFSREMCLPHLNYYTNWELGTKFTVVESKIKEVEFFPNEKQKELDCEKVLNLQK